MLQYYFLLMITRAIVWRQLSRFSKYQKRNNTQKGGIIASDDDVLDVESGPAESIFNARLRQKYDPKYA